MLPCSSLPMAGTLRTGTLRGSQASKNRRCATRQIREATSTDGLLWTVGDCLPPDPDALADQVPETLLVGGGGNGSHPVARQALFYACPPNKPVPTVNSWMYNRIRFMQRDTTPMPASPMPSPMPSPMS